MAGGGGLRRGLRALADKLKATVSPLTSSSSTADLKNTPRKRLVILGTGWAGMGLLRKVDRRLFDVRVVSPRNHFLFTPLLASTAVGTLEFRSVVQAVRATGFRDEHDFNLAQVTGIDTQKRELRCVSATDEDEVAGSVFAVPYDALAVAVGARVATYGVKGAEEYAMFLKQVADARAVRRRIIDNFETAVQETVDETKRSELLRGVLWGASRLPPTGCGEVLPVVVEACAFDVSLRQFALRKLADRPYMDIKQLSVIEVRKHAVVLSDGSEVPCGLCVWTAGVTPVPLIKSLQWEKTKGGRIKVAEAQASYLAKHLPELEAMSDDAVNEKQTKPPAFVYVHRGMMAYIGEYAALAELKDDAKLSGFGSWVLWRSAYWSKQGSMRLWIQVPLDWFKTFFFGRDMSKI
eukprot:jgi/Chlat1/9071/Chrsp94S00707